MGRPRKTDIETKIVESERRNAELRMQSNIEACKWIMVLNNHTVQHVVDKLKCLGYDLDEYRGEALKLKQKQAKGELPESAVKKGQAQRKASLDEKVSSLMKSVTYSDGSPVPAELQLPAKFMKPQDFTATYLSTKILPPLEKISFATPILKKHMTDHSATEAQNTFLEALEAHTGVLRTFVITGRLRIFDELISFLQGAAFERGRRCRDLVFPPNWQLPGVGVYSIKLVDNVIVVLQPWTGQHHTCDMSQLPPGASDTNLFVQDAFSERNASIRSTVCEETKYDLFPHFPDHVVQRGFAAGMGTVAMAKPRMVDRKKTLQDGAPEGRQAVARGGVPASVGPAQSQTAATPTSRKRTMELEKQPNKRIQGKSSVSAATGSGHAAAAPAAGAGPAMDNEEKSEGDEAEGVAQEDAKEAEGDIADEVEDGGEFFSRKIGLRTDNDFAVPSPAEDED